MIIVKCSKVWCKGHMVGWNHLGKPSVLPSDHAVEGKIKVTEELRKQLQNERGSEPFATFMDVVSEEVLKK